MLTYQDTDTGLLVQRAGQLQALSGVTMPRGNVPQAVQFCAGSVSTDAPEDLTHAWFGLKATSNMKGPWLANVELLPVAGSDGLFAAVLACNTPEMIAAMHADPADPTPEDLQITVYGQFYYFVAGVADPVPSQIIQVTVTAVLWNGAEGIAPSPNVLGPTTAQQPVSLGAVTKRTGAPADLTALANVPTAGRAPGALFFFTEAATGQLAFFRLVAGAAAVGNADHVAPADYDAATNPVHFALVPAGSAGAGESGLFPASLQTAELNGAPVVYSVAVDDTAALQAAIAAAEAGPSWQVPVLQLNRTYRIATPNALVFRKSGWRLSGVGPAAKLLLDFPSGNGLTVAPAAAPTAGNDTGLHDVLFENFAIEALQPMSAGAAIASNWTNGFCLRNVRLGTFGFTNRMNLFDGLTLSNSARAVIDNCEICSNHVGVAVSGTDVGNSFNGNHYGGVMTGQTYIQGDNTRTDSIGVYFGGGVGGFDCRSGNVSGWGYGGYVDNGLSAQINREVMSGNGFYWDNNVVCGFCAVAGLNILKFNGGWSCGNGRTSYFGNLVPAGKGQGIDVQAPNCIVNLSGWHAYMNGGSGVRVTGAGSILTSAGSQIYQNGNNGAGHGYELGDGIGAAQIGTNHAVGNRNYAIFAGAVGSLVATGNTCTGGVDGSGTALADNISCNRTSSNVLLKGNLGSVDTAPPGTQSLTVPAGGQATITFSGIPAGYQRLRVAIHGRCTASSHQSLYLRFNGDTGANYSGQEVLATNNAVNSGGAYTDTRFAVGFLTGTNAAAGAASQVVATVQSYANTVMGKTMTAQGWLASTGNYITIEGGLWANAAAIHSVTLYLGGGDFVAGTVASVTCE